jgi:hypothetical protein
MVRGVMEDMSQSMTASFEKEFAKAASRQNMWTALRSWGPLMGGLSVFFAIVFNAGYTMGAGQLPFWFRPANRLEWICSLFFLVPSGWVFFLGCLPWSLCTLKDSCSSIPKELARVAENGILSLTALGALLTSIFKIVLSVFIVAFSCLFFLIF